MDEFPRRWGTERDANINFDEQEEEEELDEEEEEEETEGGKENSRKILTRALRDLIRSREVPSIT